jgi:uncharacterized membrane protein YdjX (TVP38/TMEM64 family)
MEKKAKTLKLLPLIFILIIVALAYYLDLHKLLSFEYIKEKHLLFKNYVENHFYLSALFYILTYIAIAATSIPGATTLTLFGGLLFPQPYSTLFTVLGASLGACLIFLIARSSFSLFSKYVPSQTLKKMEKGFQKNAAHYLLSLRLIPLFPFWLVNIAPAFFNIPLRTFAWTTLIGIAPGSFAYSQAGAALNSVLEINGEINLSALLTFEMKTAIIALGLISLLPITYRRSKT